MTAVTLIFLLTCPLTPFGSALAINMIAPREQTRLTSVYSTRGRPALTPTRVAFVAGVGGVARSSSFLALRRRRDICRVRCRREPGESFLVFTRLRRQALMFLSKSILKQRRIDRRVLPWSNARPIPLMPAHQLRRLHKVVRRGHRLVNTKLRDMERAGGVAIFTCIPSIATAPGPSRS